MTTEEMRKQAHEWLDQLSPDALARAYEDVRSTHCWLDGADPDIFSKPSDIDRALVMAAARLETDERVLRLVRRFFLALRNTCKCGAEIPAL